jgi:hypothetical protein
MREHVFGGERVTLLVISSLVLFRLLLCYLARGGENFASASAETNHVNAGGMDAHIRVTPKRHIAGGVPIHLLNWCDEGALVRWGSRPVKKCLSGLRHIKRLKKEGRRSKARHPSPAHEQYTIPEPRKAA